MRSKVLLVTGGLGFIGKHFVKRCLDAGDYVINVDCVNYAADRVLLQSFDKHPNYRLMQQDIAELSHLPECDYIVNFAAESHVDNSITDSTRFCQTNVMGTHRLLTLAKAKMPGDRPRFIQISTDEVYGDTADGAHDEQSVLKPSNPYSATKAAADMLVLSFARTYGVEYNIVRPTNNYGCYQFPEKLIPKTCSRFKRGLPALLHGDGSYVRTWLHVEDTVEAVRAVMHAGTVNSIYNVAGPVELKNIDVVRKLAKFFRVSEERAFVTTPDRFGQDIRYSLDDRRIRSLGWSPKKDFDEELAIIAHSSDDFERFL